MKSLTQITLFLVLVAGTALAGSSNEQPCRKIDLLGTWELTKLDVIERGPYGNMPLYYAHQKRIFGSDGKMRHYVAQTPITPEQEKEFEKSPNRVEYAVNDQGVVTIKAFGNETDRFRCKVVGKEEVLLTWPESGTATLVHRFKKKS